MKLHLAAPVISLRHKKVRLYRRVHLRAFELERAAVIRRKRKAKLRAKKHEARRPLVA